MIRGTKDAALLLVATAILAMPIIVIVQSCAAPPKDPRQAAADAIKVLDEACALRDKYRNAGPVITTDGCPADASDASWNCTGK